MSAAPTLVGSAWRPQAIRHFLFVQSRRWQYAVLSALLAALLALPFYENDSMWLGAGVALMVLIAWHFVIVGRRVPWIPGLAIATAALQWVIAPWITYHIGAYFVAFEMAVPASQYFAYAVPALAMLVVGMLLPLRKAGRRAPPPAAKTEPLTRAFRGTCDAMVVGGILTQLVIAPMLGGGSLAFVGVLVGNLAFVVALSLLLARAPGWWIRTAAVIGVQALISASNGMFHDLLLWSSYFALTAIFVYRLRLRSIALMVVAGLAVIMVLNVVKSQFREALGTTEAGLFGRAALLGSTMIENADPEVAYEGKGFKANVTRLNQGWIIARVLYWVPNREPYAGGATIKEAVMATLLPRFLDPGKLELGGRSYFQRFTGMDLRGTSMDLSVAGETYVNNGYWGGLIGVLVFGWFVGMVYRVFLRLGNHSRLWWAWAPFVLLYSTRAENNIAEVTNLVVKSTVVMLAVIFVVPAWATLRQGLRARLARTLRLGGASGAPPRATRG